MKSFLAKFKIKQTGEEGIYVLKHKVKSIDER